jgi:hypothetical protein
LREIDTNIVPADLFGADIEFVEFKVEKAKDVVVVARMNDGGLISYRREDGTYVHTLNTVAGFERKLMELGISL